MGGHYGWIYIDETLGISCMHEVGKLYTVCLSIDVQHDDWMCYGHAIMVYT